MGLLNPVTKIDYSAIANSHTLQLITARTKSSHSTVFTGCCLVTAPNAVDSSASVFTLMHETSAPVAVYRISARVQKPYTKLKVKPNNLIWLYKEL
jgi:hypothetical protein